jgi:hypothetical protein
MARESTPLATRRLFDAALAILESLLPYAWAVDVACRSSTGGVVRVAAPDHAAGEIAVLVCDRLTTRDAGALPEPKQPTVVVASWLSPRTRELLDRAGLSYVDQTGNVYLTVSRPGLVIRTTGALRDPSPQPVKGPNIRGPRAWALLRTLVEVRPPYRVSELASTLAIDAGYVSRLLSALSGELLINRALRGPVRQVEWESVVRQMAASYTLHDANDTTNWVASAGAEQFLGDLGASKVNGWAITGSFAAAPLVSVAAPEVAVVYTEDPERIATITRLRQVRTGGNVVLARPYDRIVFERTWSRRNAVYVSLSQVVVDCLTGAGRLPAEGEALLNWLRRKAPRWQAPSLAGQADLP